LVLFPSGMLVPESPESHGSGIGQDDRDAGRLLARVKAMGE
jgi:hypothetical protein